MRSAERFQSTMRPPAAITNAPSPARPSAWSRGDSAIAGMAHLVGSRVRALHGSPVEHLGHRSLPGAPRGVPDRPAATQKPLGPPGGGGGRAGGPAARRPRRAAPLRSPGPPARRGGTGARTGAGLAEVLDELSVVLREEGLELTPDLARERRAPAAGRDGDLKRPPPEDRGDEEGGGGVDEAAGLGQRGERRRGGRAHHGDPRAALGERPGLVGAHLAPADDEAAAAAQVEERGEGAAPAPAPGRAEPPDRPAPPPAPPDDDEGRRPDATPRHRLADRRERARNRLLPVRGPERDHRHRRRGGAAGVAGAGPAPRQGA